MFYLKVVCQENGVTNIYLKPDPDFWSCFKGWFSRKPSYGEIYLSGVTQNLKIKCIRELREEFGFGLHEAKDKIEEFINTGRPVFLSVGNLPKGEFCKFTSRKVSSEEGS